MDSREYDDFEKWIWHMSEAERLYKLSNRIREHNLPLTVVIWILLPVYVVLRLNDLTNLAAVVFSAQLALAVVYIAFQLFALYLLTRAIRHLKCAESLLSDEERSS